MQHATQAVERLTYDLSSLQMHRYETHCHLSTGQLSVLRRTSRSKNRLKILPPINFCSLDQNYLKR